MNIAVLLKMTFDTEEKLKLKDGAIDEEGVKFIINPYDEYAIEEAIRLRDQHGGLVTVLSVGPERTGEALRTALAMGADEAIRIEPPETACDEAVIAALLSACLQLQPPDLILGGYFSVDQAAGQVAIRVAARLGWPHVSAVTKLEITPGSSLTAIAHRDVEGVTETIEVRLPALFTAQQGLNEPRYPSLPGIMKAKKKPFRVMSTAELGNEAARWMAPTLVHTITLPPARKEGTILRGEPDEQIRQLANLLRQHARPQQS